MKQTYVQKTNLRRLTNEGVGVWEVQSFNPKHPQLFYRVVLDEESDKISCGCPSWKYHSCEGIRKHIMTVIEEVKV